ncbi:hypothetical protein [Catenulispora rubra]|uniref:hypothetical protein n=1 Tax=Catenulispora rubra TaxID=280293 RepID=UPI00189226D1|nr:hypothetical protein [Catenulispora rubra]
MTETDGTRLDEYRRALAAIGWTTAEIPNPPTGEALVFGSPDRKYYAVIHEVWMDGYDPDPELDDPDRESHVYTALYAVSTHAGSHRQPAWRIGGLNFPATALAAAADLAAPPNRDDLAAHVTHLGWHQAPDNSGQPERAWYHTENGVWSGVSDLPDRSGQPRREWELRRGGHTANGYGHASRSAPIAPVMAFISTPA